MGKRKKPPSIVTVLGICYDGESFTVTVTPNAPGGGPIFQGSDVTFERAIKDARFSMRLDFNERAEVK